MESENSNGQQLIPFGKYRGQPLEVLESDQQYLNWLTNQDWFRSGHPKLYSIVINNFAEPCDTPEHNQMQAMFLDETFMRQFAVLALSKIDKSLILHSQPKDLKFEENGIDVLATIRYRAPPECNPCSACGGKRMWKLDSRSIPKCSACNPRTVNTYYCDLNSDGDIGVELLAIEIKPSIGDDFPSVMRQIKKLNYNSHMRLKKFLLVRNFSGQGISEEIFVRMFESQEIFVIFERNIR